jgi:hypothetical protein
MAMKAKERTKSRIKSNRPRPSAPIAAVPDAGMAEHSIDAAAACSYCGGNGREPRLPNMSGINQEALASASKVSKALVSRMLSDSPRQSRKNPTLSTMKKLRRGLEKLTGHRFPLDFVAALVE